VDARAVRETLEALEAATPETTRYALHPLNYSIGRSPWVWDYWAAVDGRDLLRVDLPAWSGCPQPPGSESVAEQASRIDALATDLPHSALSDPSVFCGLHPCSPDAGWEGIDPCRSLRPWAELQLLELGEAQSVRPDSPDHQVTLRAWKRESGP